MGLLQRLSHHRKHPEVPPTEHAEHATTPHASDDHETEPSTAAASIHSVGNVKNYDRPTTTNTSVCTSTTTQSEKDIDAVPKIIGPSVPVPGVLTNIDEKGDGARSYDAEREKADTDAPVNERGVVVGSEKATADGDEKKTDGSGEEEEEAEDETNYLKGFQLFILTFGLCMGIFVVALDNTIIGTRQQFSHLRPLIRVPLANYRLVQQPLSQRSHHSLIPYRTSNGMDPPTC